MLTRVRDLGYVVRAGGWYLVVVSRRFTAEGAVQLRERRTPTGKTAMHVDALTHQIIGAAMRVHSRVGPGLLESSYEACLKYELIKGGLNVAAQVGLPLVYDDVHLDVGYRIDLLVENEIVLEIKAQEATLPVHEAQLLSHLRLSKKKVGLLINFHVTRLTNGIKRMVDDFPEGGYDVETSDSAGSGDLAVARRPRR